MITSNNIDQESNSQRWPTSNEATAVRQTFVALEKKLAQRTSEVNGRLVKVQLSICAAFFLYGWIKHNIVGAVLTTVLLLLATSLIYALIPLLLSADKKRLDEARRALESAEKAETDRFFALAGAGIKNFDDEFLRWPDEFLGLVREKKLLYYFGPQTNHNHLLINIGKAIRQVNVTSKIRETHSTQTTTFHDKRKVQLQARPSILGAKSTGSIGAGKSTSQTTHTIHRDETFALEIQYISASAQTPAWLAMSFGDDRHGAENWRLMIKELENL